MTNTINLKQRFQNIIYSEGLFHNGDGYIETDKMSCIFFILNPENAQESKLAPQVRLNWNQIMADFEKLLDIKDLENPTKQDKLEF